MNSHSHSSFQPGTVFTISSVARAVEAQAEADALATARAKRAVDEARVATVHTLAVLDLRARNRAQGR